MSRRVPAALAAAALCFAVSLPAAGEGESPLVSNLSPSGYVTASAWATPRADDALSTAGLRGNVALSGDAGETGAFKLALEWNANGAGLADAGAAETTWYGPASFSASVADRASVDLSLKEAWFSLYAGDFDLVLGQQIVTWGQADGNNPTDNVNPRYVGTRDATTTDEKKIPVPMVNVTWNLPSGDGAVQGLFLPIPAVNRMPDMGDFVKEDIPGVSPENFEGGVRGLFYIGQSSVSVSYLTVLDRYPSDVTGFTRMMVSPMPPPGIFVEVPDTLGHTRRQIVGIDAVAFLGPYDLRAEWAYTLTDDLEGTDPYKKNPSLSGVVQGSRNFLDGRLSLALSWAPTWIQNFEEPPAQALAYASRLYTGQGFALEQAVAARAQAKFLNETLQAEAMLLTELAARDWLATVSGTYNLADGWNLKGGVNLHGSFRSSDDPLRQLGVFGNDAAQDSDSLYLELRFDF